MRYGPFFKGMSQGEIKTILKKGKGSYSMWTHISLFLDLLLIVLLHYNMAC